MTATFPHLHLAAFLEYPNKHSLVSDLGIVVGVPSLLQHSPTQPAAICPFCTPCWQLHPKLEKTSVPKIFQGYST